MEDRAVVEAGVGVGQEVGDGDGGLVLEEFGFHGAHRGFDDDGDGHGGVLFLFRGGGRGGWGCFGGRRSFTCATGRRGDRGGGGEGAGRFEKGGGHGVAPAAARRRRERGKNTLKPL